MNHKFKNLIDPLPKKYDELSAMTPCTADSVPSDAPKGGVYLFSEDGMKLYVGRTKRKIGTRIKDHFSKGDDCPLAWHLAREETGRKKATYKPKGSRKDLLKQSEFVEAYKKTKERIKKMEVRYVSEPDPLRQALLEIYVAIVSGAKFNDFDTH